MRRRHLSRAVRGPPRRRRRCRSTGAAPPARRRRGAPRRARARASPRRRPHRRRRRARRARATKPSECRTARAAPLACASASACPCPQQGSGPSGRLSHARMLGHAACGMTPGCTCAARPPAHAPVVTSRMRLVFGAACTAPPLRRMRRMERQHLNYWGAGTRTLIPRTKTWCPAVGRPPKGRPHRRTPRRLSLRNVA